MTQGDALLVLKCRTSTAENKLKALTIIFDKEQKAVFSRLNKMDLWNLSKFLYEELLKGYDDITITETNPCYHCYLGAVDRCKECDLYNEEWKGQLESPYYQKRIEFENIIDKFLDKIAKELADERKC